MSRTTTMRITDLYKCNEAHIEFITDLKITERIAKAKRDGWEQFERSFKGVS